MTDAGPLIRTVTAWTDAQSARGVTCAADAAGMEVRVTERRGYSSSGLTVAGCQEPERQAAPVGKRVESGDRHDWLLMFCG